MKEEINEMFNKILKSLIFWGLKIQLEYMLGENFTYGVSDVRSEMRGDTLFQWLAMFDSNIKLSVMYFYV